MKGAIALLSGLLFGAGLAIGGMTDPAKVIGFLDLAGAWDPSLAFVMGAALAVTLPSFQWFKRRSQPILGDRFHLPTRNDLDPRLIAGAALFGVGWGLAGLCPGPAVANLWTGSPQVLAFVIAMIGGMWLQDRVAALPIPTGRRAATAR